MQSQRLAGRKKIPATQKYLDIMEIKDDCVVLKDGTLRAVLLVSSINFALKSDEEQDAVIQAYVQFLNSLTFPVQIVIQSRKLNIDEYLSRLKEMEKQQTNELLKKQTAEYIQYINELIEISDIMSKRYYVVVPYAAAGMKFKGFFARFQEALSPTSAIHLKQKNFEKYRQELLKRVDYIVDGLAAIGLKAVTLDTQSLIELYYNTYNPETYDQQELKDINKLNLEE